MQEYNINSAALHQLTCGIPDGTGRTDIRKGFYVHQKPQDFTINLLPGHNVVLGASKTPQLITESTLREKVVSPEIQSYPQADGSVRCRCTGWKEEPFSFCSQLLRATAAFPEHLTPYYANASTKKGSDKSAESQRTAEQGAAAAAATASTSHSCAAAKLHDDILVPDASGVSECMLSSQLGFRRWVFQKRPTTRPSELCQALGIDVGNWQWGFIAGCIYHPHGCPARFLLGKRWTEPVLDVRFFGRCEHKIGVQAGRLAGPDRQLAVQEGQGRSTRQVFELLQKKLSPDELLQGNVTRTGSNPAVIRKAVSEANRRAVAGTSHAASQQRGTGDENRFAGELGTALQVCDTIKQAHTQQMKDHSLKDKVSAWGYKQNFVDNADGFSFTCFTEFSNQLWAGVCTDNLRPCLYFDATGGQVKDVDGEKVFTTFCYMQNVVSAAQPFLAWDQVLPPILLVLMVGTLKTWEYVFAGMGKFFQLIASTSQAAAAEDAGPCSRRFLPGCVFTDHDNAIMNGWCRLVNLCRAATYRSIVRRLLLALADHATQICHLEPSLAATATTAQQMTHQKLTAVAHMLVPMNSKQQKEHNNRAASIASALSRADEGHLPVLFDKLSGGDDSLSATAAFAAATGVAPTAERSLEDKSDAGELQQHARAALLLLSILQWFVHLRLCAWHWIKACHDYGLYGAPFKHLDTSSRRFWAFVLSVAIGRPAIQTRFRGLSGIIAGRLYLRGVIKLFRQKYLIAHPQLPVEQLDGWLLVQPGTTADVKPSSRSVRLYNVEYHCRGTTQYRNYHAALPEQVRSYSDSICEVSWTTEDAPQNPTTSSAVSCSAGLASASGLQHGDENTCQFELQSWQVTDTEQQDVQSHLHALFASGTPMSDACAGGKLAAAGFEVFSNPLFCPAAADYAENIIEEDLDVSAFQYLDELHPQLDNPFNQVDSKAPHWAVTNRSTGRVEGGIKDSKHTQGSGAGPVSLSTFLQRQYEIANAHAKRYWSDLQHLGRLRHTSRRMQALEARQAKYEQSAAASVRYPLDDALGVAPAIRAGMLPLSAAAEQDQAVLSARCAPADEPADDAYVAATTPGAAGEALQGDAHAPITTSGSGLTPSTVMMGLTLSEQNDRSCDESDVPFHNNSGFSTAIDCDGPIREEVTEWGPKRKRRVDSSATHIADVSVVDAAPRNNFVTVTGGRQRPQRKAALKLPSVLKAAGLLDDGAGQEYQVVTAQGDAIVASASGKASQREGESVGMSTVTTVAGGLLQVKTGDHVVIRTCEKNNPYAMCTDARTSKYRVYILQLTELEQQCARKAHACLRGRGCWYLNHHKHIASPLQAPISSDIWIRLDGYVVAAWGGDALSMLTAEQVAYINRHVLDGL